MSLIRIDVDTDMSAADVDQHVSALSTGIDAGRVVASIARLFEKFACGAYNAALRLVTGGVKATGTVTFSSFVADDTVTVGGVVLTGKASPANENQFVSTGNDAADAVAFAACVNAHSTLSKVFSVATPTTATATVTCIVPGAVGNNLGLAISAHGSVSGALLTGGVDGTATVISKGR